MVSSRYGGVCVCEVVWRIHVKEKEVNRVRSDRKPNKKAIT